jgi:hypothetical protein
MTHKDSVNYEPCENCGEQHFKQQVIQTEEVRVDENGEPDEFVPTGSFQVQRIWCVECDELVFDQISNED